MGVRALPALYGSYPHDYSTVVATASADSQVLAAELGLSCDRRSDNAVICHISDARSRERTGTELLHLPHISAIL